MHNLLKRQLKKCFGESFQIPKEWQKFVEVVNDAYIQSDIDRGMIERSLDLSSKELLDINSEMRSLISLLNATIDSTADGILVVDKQGKIVNFNQKFAEMWHIPQQIMESRDDNQALSFVLEQLKDPEAFIKKVRELYDSPEAESFDELYFKDGRVFERYSQPQRIGKTVVGRVWSFRDITERRKMEEKVKQCVSYDILTGLPNRVLFLDYLKATMARADRQKGYKFAVIVFNIDRFKKIIDSLGHFAGDQLLIKVATRLKKHLRAYDTVARIEYEAIARLGGDEFAVLLSDIKNIRNVISITERLHNTIKLPIEISDHILNITVSMGIKVSNPTYEKPEDILRDADTAMYKAKTLGKNRYVIFDENMHTQAVSYLQLENSLQQAIEKNQFLLNYQPIVLLETNEFVGFEALLRWKSPEKGLISPNEFIPLAEETGLIIPIGRWVLLEACRQMRSWHRLFSAYSHLTINVNVSIKQYTFDLVKAIKQILDETGINPASLKLEITESVIINNPENAAKVFLRLKDLNIKMQLDDFGTGYSSLRYLHQFPFDALKIDKSFVQSMCDNSSAMEIVKTIVTMAHNMKMDVVAEGVETVQQLEELRKLKCDYYQGYLFSRPLNWQDAEALISRIIK